MQIERLFAFCVEFAAKHGFHYRSVRGFLSIYVRKLGRRSSKVICSHFLYPFYSSDNKNELSAFRPDSSNSFDWFSERQTKVLRYIRSFLQTNSTAKDPNAVNQTRIMYQACMNTGNVVDSDERAFRKQVRMTFCYFIV